MDTAEVINLIFDRLGDKELAIACCCSHLWRDIGYVDHLWRALCIQKWPICQTPEALRIIEAMGGFRVFFSRRALTMDRRPKQLQPRPWLRHELLTFFVDLTYKGFPIISEVLSGNLIGSSCNIGIQIHPSVSTDSILPKHALTPLSYQGQTYYEKPFQALYTARYWLNWSVVRSNDHKMACLLHSDPVPDAILPWEEDGDDGGDDFRLPLLFQRELVSDKITSSRLRNQNSLFTYAYLDCKPVWGDSMGDPMVFELVELQLGIRKSEGGRAPSVDRLLMALQELDWK
ncbi:hypothetical protein O6H91_07G070400 [Diphasiastrum complanatum]|uniref:Uncharacterized protein n=1 Tax=Diphasiastrum complanatum TaxID=34168 RepID=A0ACC2D6B7_DIPCM|nr:hypothetical protein O6H91_07G070400 [Diphasiastrum complanatum]